MVFEETSNLSRDEEAADSCLEPKDKSTNQPNLPAEVKSFEASMDVTMMMDAELGDQCENKELQAHKVVLAAASPVFRAMFFGGFEDTTTVRIKGIRPVIFRALIGFIYGNPLTLSSLEEHLEMFMAADQYDIRTVTHDVERYLCSRLKWQNCVEMYNLFSMLPAARLKESCLALFSAWTEDILEHPSFLRASADTVDAVCCITLTYCHEVDFYRAMERWVHAQKGDVETAKNSIRRSLCTIRFLSFHRHELKEVTLLDPAEKEALYRNLLRPGSAPMPAGFSTETAPRRPYSPSDEDTEFSDLEGESTDTTTDAEH